MATACGSILTSCRLKGHFPNEAQPGGRADGLHAALAGKSLDAHFDPELKGPKILRRYIDLPKLVDFLRPGGVFLGRASRFEDHLKGTLPEGIRLSIRKQT